MAIFIYWWTRKTRTCWRTLISCSFVEFRSEVKTKISRPIRPGRSSYFSDRPENHKLDRRRCDLASCQVSLNSVHTRSRKCLGQSEAVAIFRSTRKIHTWKRTMRSCCLSSFIEFRSAVLECPKWLSQSGWGGQLVFISDRLEKYKLGRIFFYILLPVTFRWIPFSGFREVENVSANQRPGWPSGFFDRPKKDKLNLGTEFDFLLNFREVSIEHLQRVRYANIGRLLLRTLGPVPLWDLHVFQYRDRVSNIPRYL